MRNPELDPTQKSSGAPKSLSTGASETLSPGLLAAPGILTEAGREPEKQSLQNSEDEGIRSWPQASGMA